MADSQADGIDFDSPGVPAIGALAALLDPVVATAVEACRAAHDSAIEAEGARRALLTARADDGRGRIHLTEERTQALTFRAAVLLIAAHMRAEEAEGVARAVGLARRGEVRAPRDRRVDEDVVFGPAVRHAG